MKALRSSTHSSQEVISSKVTLRKALAAELEHFETCRQASGYFRTSLKT